MQVFIRKGINQNLMKSSRLIKDEILRANKRLEEDDVELSKLS